MENAKLVTGLKFFIDEVKLRPDCTEFVMNEYKACVIGRIVGWNIKSFHREFMAARVALHYFGVCPSNDWVFSEQGHECVTPEQWEVIRLFTSDIGYLVTREEWLELAEEVLKKFESGSL